MLSFFFLPLLQGLSKAVQQHFLEGHIYTTVFTSLDKLKKSKESLDLDQND
jgi:hypothetical protein